MKKVLKFIKDNAVSIVAIIVVIFIIAWTILPLFVAIGKNMWDIAINNPAAIM